MPRRKMEHVVRPEVSRFGIKATVGQCGGLVKERLLGAPHRTDPSALD